jgi:hypothetical protein
MASHTRFQDNNQLSNRLHWLETNFKPLLFSPDELLGKKFERTLNGGKSYRAKIVRKIQDLDAANHANFTFLDELGDGAFNEIIAYGTLCKCIEDPKDGIS